MNNLSTESMLRRMRHIPKTVECGLHSGIPLCCIKFYVMRWMFSLEESAFRRAHNKMMRRWGMASVGYIPCDACCRIGHCVVIKPCPEQETSCDHSEEQAR